jgi:hypothetical protein
MSRNWISEGVLLNGTSVVIGASETDTVVSKSFRIMNPKYIVVDVECSASTVSTGITAKLQDSSGNNSSGTAVWNTKGAEGNVAITGNDTFSFVLMIENSSDQAELPLRPLGRIVVTSGSGDAVTIDSVKVSHY